MRRYTVFILAFLLSTAFLSACNRNEYVSGNDRISIVSTIFPPYDWVRQILGDKADTMELTLLLDGRVDLHNYQPTAADILTISTSDLFIYVGGESDKWVSDALRQTSNPNMIVINLLDLLGDEAKMEEIVEGMEDVHDDDDEDEDHDDEDHEDDDDEHVWLSLRNAAIFSTAIADALSALDQDNAEEFKNNLFVYLDQLSALDTLYQAAVNDAPVMTLLFGDRFPFRYLTDDYGLSYYAAFPGCSAETEASFNTIVFLAEKIDEINLNTVMVTESTDQSIARTIVSNTKSGDQQILMLDSMQSISPNNISDGVTYLSIMESNLNVLIEALK